MSDSITYRWGIPGWILVASFMIFVALDALSAHDNTVFAFLESVFSADSFWQAALFGFLVAGSAIPIGYLLWQIYFYVRWNSPVSKGGLWPPFIEGRSTEFMKGIEGIDFPEQITPLLKIDKDDYKTVWKFVATVLHEAIHQVSGDPESAIKRHSFLINTFHSLGASMLGAAFGFGIYMILKYRFEEIHLAWILIAVVYTAVMLMLLSAEHRHPDGYEWLKIRIIYPAEVFLAASIFLFINLLPGLNNLVPNQPPGNGAPENLILFLSVGLAIIWIVNAKDIRPRLFVLTYVLVIVQFWLKHEHVDFLTSSAMNWPAVLAILVFQFFVIAFVKNRHNTGELLEAFENYYLYMFFNKNKDGRIPYPAPRPRSSPRRRSTPGA